MNTTYLFTKEQDVDVYLHLAALVNCLREICALSSTVKKLTYHPIKDWVDSLESDIYLEMVMQGHLILGEKEINELYEDFKNSKNRDLKHLVSVSKKISDELAEKYVDPDLRRKFWDRHKTTVEP
jgi:hypothetical protein